MKERQELIYCAACGQKFQPKLVACPHCNSPLPPDLSSATCAICFHPQYYFYFPHTNRHLVFCSNPTCGGWTVYHSGSITYYAHDKDVKFILTSRPKTLQAVMGSYKEEIVPEYETVFRFIQRIRINNPRIDNKVRFK